MGIQHPGTGDAAGDFQELVDIDPEKACQQNEITLLFVNAPKHDESRRDEKKLVAELGEEKHEGVHDGVADGFKPIEYFHGFLL